MIAAKRALDNLRSKAFAGVDDYVTKPLAIEALLDKIAVLCARQAVAGCSVPGHRMLNASCAMLGAEEELSRLQDAGTPGLLAAVGAIVSIGLMHVAVSWRKQWSAWFGRLVDGTGIVECGQGQWHQDRMRARRYTKGIFTDIDTVLAGLCRLMFVMRAP